MLYINGEACSTADNLTVLELLVLRNLKPERVAVERNGGIVRRADFSCTKLEDGDHIEIVHFVGGG